jgi:hypothetical protein
MEFRVVTDAFEQLALFTTVFDCTTERHAALVFLLTAGFYGAVAVFVGTGHFESPNASTGVQDGLSRLRFGGGGMTGR